MTGKPLLIFFQPWLISLCVSFLYCESKHFYIPASICFISSKSILNPMKFPDYINIIMLSLGQIVF